MSNPGEGCGDNVLGVPSGTDIILGVSERYEEITTKSELLKRMVFIYDPLGILPPIVVTF